MNPKTIFINAAGRLRSGWRVLIFALLFVTLLFVMEIVAAKSAGLVAPFAPSRGAASYIENLIWRLALLFAALLAGYVCTRWIEGLPWRALGLWLHAGWLRDLLIGSLIGIASLALATVIATAGGGLRFSIASRTALFQVGTTLVFSAILFIVAALAEEALFRGYPLQTFTRARLIWLAIVLTSVPFALGHLRNPNVAAGFTFINTAMAGVWLAVAYLKTRSLWFPLGVHWAWNWAMASVCGLPVSGITTLAPHSLLHGIDLGPAWLTGGTYGPEGGLACTITLVVSTLFIWRTKLVSATPEMKTLTSQEKPAPGLMADKV